MKKIVSAATFVVVVLGVFAGTVLAGGKGDAVTAGGTTSVGTHMGISAHDGPNGPTGHVVLKNFENFRGEQQGKVVCIEATGNVATLVYRITKADSDIAQVGDYRKLRLEDHGNPVRGQPVDRITANNLPGSPTPLTCDTPLAPFGSPITHGNIRVVDAG